MENKSWHIKSSARPQKLYLGEEYSWRGEMFGFLVLQDHTPAKGRNGNLMKLSSFFIRSFWCWIDWWSTCMVDCCPGGWIQMVRLNLESASSKRSSGERWPQLCRPFSSTKPWCNASMILSFFIQHVNLVCIASWVHVKVQNGAKTVLWVPLNMSLCF